VGGGVAPPPPPRDAHVWVQHFGSHCGRGRPEDAPEHHLRHDLARSVAVG
jgi:hypothetical protein